MTALVVGGLLIIAVLRFVAALGARPLVMSRRWVTTHTDEARDGE